MSASEMGGDLILRDERSGSVYRLNAVAGLIWQLCDGARDTNTITSEVAALFGKAPAEVAPDVDAILARFTDTGLIRSARSRDREHELLLSCVRMAIGTEKAKPIGELLGEDVDWTYLIQMALHHQVMPLVCLSLRANFRDEVPKVVLDRLRRHYLANARHNRFLMRELLGLLGDFEAHHIQALTLKGPILAKSGYGNVGARQFGDLDIFVPAAQIGRANNLLAARGYRLRGSHDMQSEWTSGDGRACVDLQGALAPKRFRSPIELEQLWSGLERVSVERTTVWQPGPADYVLLLSAHGAKHCWSSLGWIVDVAAFTRMQGTRLDWRHALDRARYLGGERQLLLGLRLASHVLGTNVPAEVLPRMRADRAVASLASELRERLFTPNDNHFQGSYGFVEGSLLYIKTRERLRDKVPCASHLLQHRFRWLTVIVMPNEHDRAVVALPRSMAFLYFLVRPLRLVGKRVSRLAQQYWKRPQRDHHLSQLSP